MKMCVVSFDRFWENLTPNQIQITLRAFAALTRAEVTGVAPIEDTLQRRKRAYNNLIADLRSKNELCEHPSHGHPITKQ
jgi:hypothetical protein